MKTVQFAFLALLVCARPPAEEAAPAIDVPIRWAIFELDAVPGQPREWLFPVTSTWPRARRLRWPRVSGCAACLSADWAFSRKEPATELLPGERVALRIRYSGAPGTDTRDFELVFDGGAPTDRTVVPIRLHAPSPWRPLLAPRRQTTVASTHEELEVRFPASPRIGRLDEPDGAADVAWSASGDAGPGTAPWGSAWLPVHWSPGVSAWTYCDVSEQGAEAVVHLAPLQPWGTTQAIGYQFALGGVLAPEVHTLQLIGFPPLGVRIEGEPSAHLVLESRLSAACSVEIHADTSSQPLRVLLPSRSRFRLGVDLTGQARRFDVRLPAIAFVRHVVVPGL